MISKEYFAAIIEHHLKKVGAPHLNVNQFCRESGLTKSEVMTYLRENGWQEMTIGTFVKKR